MANKLRLNVNVVIFLFTAHRCNLQRSMFIEEGPSDPDLSIYQSSGQKDRAMLPVCVQRYSHHLKKENVRLMLESIYASVKPSEFAFKKMWHIREARILIPIALKFVPKDPIFNVSALVQVMVRGY